MKIFSKKTHLFLCLSFLIIGCSESNNVSKPNFNFVVTSDEKKTDIKRTITVELDKRLDVQQLREIAEYLKSTDSNYENIFIAFKIKGEQRDVYWATVSFSPETNVTILGSNIEEEKNLQKEISQYKLPEGSEQIGRWMNRSAYDSAMVFYKKGGEFFADEIFDSGINKINFTQQSDENGVYFKKEDSSDGYRITKDGSMDIFNIEEKRKIYTIYPIEIKEIKQ